MSDSERFILILVLAGLMAFVVWYEYQMMRRKNAEPKSGSRTTSVEYREVVHTPNQSAVVEREKVIEREVVVNVKCRYCGTLNDQTAQRCSSCGGSI